MRSKRLKIVLACITLGASLARVWRDCGASGEFASVARVWRESINTKGAHTLAIVESVRAECARGVLSLGLCRS